ncbi:hypothetical protein ASPZODRAFT_134274 [Penicilliopsis zonata CBS 506.65]|uniref:Putative gamma-glutamylcyclotransferase n=1 Tax=Penicilliopsis zonata CBS 506.65 TaxID=1073090 RepID=A0A1L9SCK8_9EURO|nr:hypothetical protein ASPZODRAFT_134274 [Penicilliopsis zonata CBS 506.65]OJJ44872.1 hypothetical protein ASPZODRAFT_134274 [Penicilliopsis zonata CBS 506.65]
MSEPSPPSPPPPPPAPAPKDLRSKISPFVLKLRNAPPELYHRSLNTPPLVDPFDPPVGPYFFYGTLMDPKLLADILDLAHEPKLRPAKVVGHSCKLWGQYPAMVDGPQEGTVEGAVYNVQTVKAGEKLAAYETNNYTFKACLIEYTDGQKPADDLGHAFLFAGNPHDLTEGTFDLKTWLRRMGRQDTKERT